MIKTLLSKVASKEDLSYNEAKTAVKEIMSGECTPEMVSAFLTALAMKGETDEEIAGCADGMRSRALKMDTDCDTLDIVGTGGDRSHSFNISTTAAFVLAGTGVKIAKHGNRAASSSSGAADCLGALGVKITAAPEVMEKALEEDNISFLFAQKYHSAMKYVGPVRKEIGIRTVFNILGPLTNPAGAKMMVLGVFSEDFVSKVANALVKLGVTDALVVYGNDCLDEVSACGETSVAEVRNGRIKYYTITPEQFGYKRCKKRRTFRRHACRECRYHKSGALRRRHVRPKACRGHERRGGHLCCRKRQCNAGGGCQKSRRSDRFQKGVEGAG